MKADQECTFAELLAVMSKAITSEKVNPNVIQTARICVLDYLGALFAGLQEFPAVVVREWVREQSGCPESSILGYRCKVPASNAALGNATSSHIVELDDVHSACMGHPGAVVVSTALAMCEKLGLDGESFLLSIIAGYEVMCRCGIYMGTSHYKLWHPTCTLGVFGSAATSVKCMRLDMDKASNAISIAATMSCGLREAFIGGSNCKHIHPGLAARNGIIAAQMAEKGFTGPLTAMEGNMGFRRAFQGEGNDAAREWLPNGRLYIEDTEFKIFASCRSAHTAAEAGIRMHAYADPHLIESIELEVPGMIAEDGAWGNLSPENALAAKLSVPYNFVVSLLDGECYLEQFSPTRLEDPTIGVLLSRTKIVPSQEMDGFYPDYVGVRARIALKNGSVATETVTIPIGHSLRPLDVSTLHSKFINLASPIIGENAGRLSDLILNLDNTVKLDEIVQLCVLPETGG